MRKASDSYRACVARSTTAEGRRERLLKAADTVQKAGQVLRDAAASRNLHDLDSKGFTVPEFAGGTFVAWAYGNGMQTVEGRVIRDELMAAPPNERCPLCRQGTVRQLDHFMPKSLFPALCVDPLNLVPVCERCNLIKGNKRPDSAENTLLHPYLDRISHESWLDARTLHGSGTVQLRFFVSPPVSWDATLIARAKNHFTLFELGTRYAIEANRVISDITYGIDRQRKRGGARMVRDYLQEQAETRLAVDLNSCEGVTYRTLAADDFYCHGPSTRDTPSLVAPK
ncbi:HNH endonuclease [Streptomyces sp. NPDC002680]|uniref:HNH endonuclease n=1 Tax=Streptomyces sp. NPDC002680 TaxID=3364659 RepID=UPI00367E5500